MRGINKNPRSILLWGFLFHATGGERGIRTLGTVAHTTVFETVPFDRSGISPEQQSIKKAANAALAEREGFEPPDL